MPSVQTLCLKSVSVCLHCQQHIWQSWRRHVTFASSAHPDSQGLMTWKDTQSLYIWAWLPVWVCIMCLGLYAHVQIHIYAPSNALLCLLVGLSGCVCTSAVFSSCCVFACVCMSVCVFAGVSVRIADWDLFLQCSESPSASGPVVLNASRVIRTGHADQ